MPKLVRNDYQPPVYKIDQVHLDFSIAEPGAGDTIVTGTMHYYGTPGAPLVLNAQHPDLISITINGKELDLNSVIITPDEDFHLITVKDVPPEGVLVIKNRIKPWGDNSGEGLYEAGGTLVTQCESQSFRKIIPFIDRPDNLARFTCTITANEQRLPVLLSNGNLLESGQLPDGRHFVKYEDPWPKPSYLFAIVAGNIACIKDHYFTRTGRRINLFVHVDPKVIGQAGMALEALKAAMQWDEARYDLEYDLDNCHLVGLSKFNAGAMENKGLITFNDQCLLADPRSTTDAKQMYVWDVVSHEYFHNFAGNRVTVREWLELALKEGLATRKESDFMMDTFGRDVYRLDEVRELRVRQFPEDAGPTRHAVRPSEVESIDNIYTTTVYTKGAELLAMLSRMLGRETFTSGVKHYFKKFDGQAVTIEDFISAQEEVSGRDLQQFLLWYTTPGTPRLYIQHEYTAENKVYKLHVKQSLTDIAGNELPAMHIPIAFNMLDGSGKQMLLNNVMLELTSKEQTFVFNEVTEQPIPSFLRDFSAPVIVAASPLSFADKLFLYKYDQDPINRSLMGAEVMQQCILNLAQQLQSEEREFEVPDEFYDAIEHILNDSSLSLAMKAELIELPLVQEIIAELDTVDLDNLMLAHQMLTRFIADEFEEEFAKLYAENNTWGKDALTPELVGKRRMRNLCLEYLMIRNEQQYIDACKHQFYVSTSMTESKSALACLVTMDYNNCDAIRAEVLQQFYERWKHDSQAMDTWFRIQASSNQNNTIENLRKLMQSSQFDVTIPNHVYAVVCYFAYNNPKNFHRADGEGYKFVIDAVTQVDPINSSVASRIMLELFNNCQKFDTARQALMLAELRRLAAVPGLSAATRDLVNKKLAAAPAVASIAQSEPMLTQFKQQMDGEPDVVPMELDPDPNYGSTQPVPAIYPF
jgi:aminopeptidase N